MTYLGDQIASRRNEIASSEEATYVLKSFAVVMKQHLVVYDKGTQGLHEVINRYDQITSRSLNQNDIWYALSNKSSWYLTR